MLLDLAYDDYYEYFPGSLCHCPDIYELPAISADVRRVLRLTNAIEFLTARYLGVVKTGEGT